MAHAPTGQILTKTIHTLCGTLLLGAWQDVLCLCEWDVGRTRRSFRRLSCLLDTAYCEGTSAVLEEAARQLEDYFAGRRRIFDLPILTVGTAFQKRVWQELMKIPYGETVTYSDVAIAVGCSAGVRAVATAIRDNAISVIVPCHRVVARQRGKGGYSGGMQTKRWLLEMEHSQVSPPLRDLWHCV